MTSLTELEKLIAGATDGKWVAQNGDLLRVKSGPLTICGVHRMGVYGGPKKGNAEINSRLIAASRQALPNALRVIAECKRHFERIRRGSMYQIGWESDGKDCGVAIEALALIAEFENNVEGGSQ